MATSPEAFDRDDNPSEPHALDTVERPPALTPLLELMRGDGYRWASLDVVDLDPPTRFPPHSAN